MYWSAISMRLLAGRVTPAMRAIGVRGTVQPGLRSDVSLTLTLLMLRTLRADDHDPAFTPDNLAIAAHGLHGRAYFHTLKGLESIDNPSFCQIIGADLDLDLIPGGEPNAVFPQFSCHMTQNHLPVLEFDPERSGRQVLLHDPFHNKEVLAGRSGSLCVIAAVSRHSNGLIFRKN